MNCWIEILKKQNRHCVNWDSCRRFFFHWPASKIYQLPPLSNVPITESLSVLKLYFCLVFFSKFPKKSILAADGPYFLRLLQLFLGPRGPLVLPLVDPYTRTPVRAKNLYTYIQAYMPHESSGDSSNQPIGHMGSPRRLP